MNTIIINIISGLAISIVTAVVTVRLSIRQFTTQRWWEKKTEAYSELIENLAKYKISKEKLVDDLLHNVTYSNEYKVKVKDDLQKADENITIFAVKGAFIISNEVSDELNKLISKINEDMESEYWIECSEEHPNLIHEAIKKIVNLAKKDLNENIKFQI